MAGTFKKILQKVCAHIYGYGCVHVCNCTRVCVCVHMCDGENDSRLSKNGRTEAGVGCRAPFYSCYLCLCVETSVRTSSEEGSVPYKFNSTNIY